jgi:hypothetical protein
MWVTVFAALSMTLAGQSQDPPPQDPPSQDPPVTQVEDIVVFGNRPLIEAAREFVAEVGEAPRGRGLARWRGPICIGVVNLRPEAAGSLIDHISARADELGVATGDAGCTPNVVLAFTQDPQTLADGLVEAEPGQFRLGSATFNLSADALRHFRESDAPIRWWHTSIPVDDLTGEPAVRIPGALDAQGNPATPTTTGIASRLTSGIRDDLSRVYIIVDMRRVGDVSPLQLGDYLAFVALAQIDPMGDRSRQPSVLNAFEDPQSSEGFSDWDLAYLRALYRPGGGRRANSEAIAGEVARDVARTLRLDQETG